MGGNRTPYVISGRERAAYGCLCSFENAEGLTFTIHRTGPTIPAARDACEAALTLDQTFRLVAYSTPQTIYTDLTGGRADYEVTHESIRATYAKANPVSLPELQALARIGRKELLHPRLVKASKRDSSREAFDAS